MKKGFATSAILYTLLLLFLVLMVGILNNLQNKKTILDALKKDTISALERDTVIDAILDQIGIINSKIVEVENKIETMNHKITTLEEEFHNYQQELSTKIHRINASYEYNTSTTYQYTGVNQAIPANSYFCLSVIANYNDGSPDYITITTSANASNASTILAEGGRQHYNSTATYCGYAETATTYYIWEKRESLPSSGLINIIFLSGFYITI